MFAAAPFWAFLADYPMRRLLKIISMIDKTAKWQLLTGTPQSQWVSSSGKMLIMGDAAHAMLPYMSQGTSNTSRETVSVKV